MIEDMSNPILNERAFSRAAGRSAEQAGWAAPQSGTGTWQAPITDGPVSPWERTVPMTAGGAISAAILLAVLLVGAAVFGWSQAPTADSAGAPGWILGGVLVGLVAAMVSFFKPPLARIFAPIYALAQGVAVGAISRVFDEQYDGIVLQAVGATLGVFVVMLVLYRTGVIRVTDRFRRTIIGATLGVLVFYGLSLLLSLFGLDGGRTLLNSNGMLGIGISVVVAAIAAFNLALDFDFIERASAARAPKHMEWVAALGLLVTIVWLYLEMLRLLAKLRSR